MTLRDEILEQPDVAARLLDRADDPIRRIAQAVRERGFDHVLIAARGTSDHAAIYAQYLFGVVHRLPVALAAPSILSLYGTEPRFARTLVIGISQSGASPDVVGVVVAGRRQGVPTIAITNDPASPLAAAAEHLIDIGAGAERSIAATKTYTAELLSLAMLSAALGGTPDEAALERVPDWMRAALEAEPAAAEAATARAAMDRCTVLGRGFEYASAREWALKLKELARVVADPYSSADFRHGPLALVEPGFPVLAIAPSGAAAADLDDLLGRLVHDFDADLVAVSDRPATLALGRSAIPLPAGMDERLSPIVSIVPAQLFALHLTLAKGLDPEVPRHLNKVTETL